MEVPVRPWTRRTLVLLVGALILVGLAIRLYAIGRQSINADQAVVGLMAEQILKGHLSAFYWGQNYGGGEPYLVAGMFAIFGGSTLSLGLTPVLLDLIAALLLWRIGRRLFGPWVGISAALLFWIWPEVYIWQSTIEYGFRWFVLDLGLAALLFALRCLDERASRRWWEFALLGLFLGAGWWGSPEIMYFALPIAGFVIYRMVRDRLRLRIRDVSIAMCSAVLGAGVWIWTNVQSHLASLRAGVQPNNSIPSHLKTLVEHALPLLLGIQLRASGRWLFGVAAGSFVTAIAIFAAIVLLGILLRRGEAVLLVFFCLLAPIVYVISPFTWYWSDGRYGLFLAPATSLLVIVGFREGARYLPRFSQRYARLRRVTLGERQLTAGAVLVGLLLTLWAGTQIAPYHPNGVASTGSASWTSWRSDPEAGFHVVANKLEANGIHDLYAGYWVAYPLMFAANSTLTASDISYVRNPALLDSVARSSAPAWLLLDPSRYRLGVALTGVSLMDPSCAAKSDRCLTPHELTHYLVRLHIGYRTFEVSPFVAVVPDRKISPAAISRWYHLRPAYRLPH